jgi:hypothetical protein
VERGYSYDLWARKLGGPGYFILLPTTVAEGRNGLHILSSSVLLTSSDIMTEINETR